MMSSDYGHKFKLLDWYGNENIELRTLWFALLQGMVDAGLIVAFKRGIGQIFKRKIVVMLWWKGEHQGLWERCTDSMGRMATVRTVLYQFKSSMNLKHSLYSVFIHEKQLPCSLGSLMFALLWWGWFAWHQCITKAGWEVPRGIFTCRVFNIFSNCQHMFAIKNCRLYMREREMSWKSLRWSKDVS